MQKVGSAEAELKKSVAQRKCDYLKSRVAGIHRRSFEHIFKL